MIGEKIGKAAFAFGEQYFSKTSTPTQDGLANLQNVKVYPNPISSNSNEIKLELPTTHPALQFELINQQGAKLKSWKMEVDQFQAGFPYMKAVVWLLGCTICVLLVRANS